MEKSPWQPGVKGALVEERVWLGLAWGSLGVMELFCILSVAMVIMTWCLCHNCTPKRVHFTVSFKIKLENNDVQGPNGVPFELHPQISRSLLICPPVALLLMSSGLMVFGHNHWSWDSVVFHLPAECPSHSDILPSLLSAKKGWFSTHSSSSHCDSSPTHQQGGMKNKLRLTVCVKSLVSLGGQVLWVSGLGYEQTLSTGF